MEKTIADIHLTMNYRPKANKLGIHLKIKSNSLFVYVSSTKDIANIGFSSVRQQVVPRCHGASDISHCCHSLRL